jgi:hypothetical protein
LPDIFLTIIFCVLEGFDFHWGDLMVLKEYFRFFLSVYYQVFKEVICLKGFICAEITF